MASLEQRNGRFRIVFRFGGQKLSRSLKTKDEDDANGAFARLQDNLRRAELGHLAVPEGADVAAFLLSDGRALAKPTLPKVRTLKQLLESYMATLPAGSIEQSTRQGMDIHIATCGACSAMGSLSPASAPPTCNGSSMPGHWPPAGADGRSVRPPSRRNW